MVLFVKRFYLGLIAIGASLQSPVLFLIRLYWGWSFCRNGFGKLSNIGPIIDFFKSLHIPMPELNAHVAASVECFGGAFLLLGLASRLVAIPLMITMCVAYLTAFPDSVKTLLTNPQNFVQDDPFNFLLAALLVFVFGPGGISIDYLLKKKFNPQGKL